MRDLNISAKDALMMDLMDYLESAPRRERRKYGKRKHLSMGDFYLFIEYYHNISQF
jgi:hypothetical protein